MAGRLIGAWNPALDDTGIALSGSKLFTFATGTSTPKQTFTTSALNVANSNPLVADAAGRFGEAWAADGVVFDLDWKSSGGVLIKSFLGIQTLGATASGAVTRDFGADGRFNMEARGGTAYLEAGDPTPDNSGGTWRIGGWAGTQADMVVFDSADFFFTNPAAARVALNMAGALVGNGTFAGSSAPGVALAGYDRYEVVFAGLIPSGNPTLTMQVSFDNGGSWKAGASDYAYNFRAYTNIAGITRSSGDTSFEVSSGAMDTTAGRPNTAIIQVCGPRAAGFGISVNSILTYWSAGSFQTDHMDGHMPGNYGAPTNLRLVASAGTLSGSYAVYGLRGL